jgi:hypothetical protein
MESSFVPNSDPFTAASHAETLRERFLGIFTVRFREVADDIESNNGDSTHWKHHIEDILTDSCHADEVLEVYRGLIESRVSTCVPTTSDRTETGCMEITGAATVTPWLQRDLVARLLGEELWTRYGVCFARWCVEMRFGVTLDSLARVTTFRVCFHAVSSGITFGFQNIRPLVDGVVRPFRDFPRISCCFRFSEIFEATSILEPGLRFWIPKDCQGNEFEHGLICVPENSFQHSDYEKHSYYGYRQQEYRPDRESGAMVKQLLESSSRYVSIDHILDYLNAITYVSSSGSNPIEPIQFGLYLCRDRRFSQEFKTSVVVKAIFRGHIDSQTLTTRGLKFERGIFDGVDFSFCTLANLTISSMKRCQIVGATFSDCVIVGAAFDETLFIFCRFANCCLESTSGRLSFNWCCFGKSSFANANLHLMWGGKLVAALLLCLHLMNVTVLCR